MTGQTQASVYHLYSIGTAAENMEFGKRDLEVWPGEQMFGLDGDVTTNLTNISSEGQNATGEKYTQNINTGTTIPAKWLSRNSNRPFPSLIRRGEKVKIWRNSDTSEFWWEEMGDDIHMRRGDIYTLACISTIIDKDTPISHENSYWFEIDSLNGVIRLSTTKLNGEACTYLFQIMTREGTFKLEDDIGNLFLLESVDQRWTLKNAADTTLVMDGANTTLSMSGKYTVNAQECEYNIQNVFTTNCNQKVDNFESSWEVNTNQSTINSMSNYTINSASIALNGPLVSSGYGGGAGSAEFNGKMTLNGDSTTNGDSTVNGTLMNDGKNVTTHKHRGDSGGQTGPME